MSGNSRVIEEVIREAEISADGLYRFTLTRVWDTRLPRCGFIMLNPSTADSTIDDPTIRRCIKFARGFGFGSLNVGNLYALRATDPQELWRASEPAGNPRNDQALAELLQTSSTVIAAWGHHAKPDRVHDLLNLPRASRLKALGITKTLAPRHPLYVRSDAQLVSWPSEVGGGRQ